MSAGNPHDPMAGKAEGQLARLWDEEHRPPVSETAAWTEQDERALAIYGDLSDAVGSEPRTVAIRFAREILRLRADNERLRVANEALDVAMMANAREVESLRAATRERETT